MIELPILQRAENKLESTVSSPKTGGIRLRIEGMTCTGCAAGIQRAIEARTDVTAASVSFAAGTAEIEGRDLQPKSLIETIERRGFQAELIEAGDEPIDQSDIERQQHANERTWRNRAIVGMGLWIPLETLHWISTAMHWHGIWMPWVMFFGSLIIILFALTADFADAAVGRTPGGATVSADGEAVYSIPLDLPPGHVELPATMALGGSRRSTEAME